MRTKKQNQTRKPHRTPNPAIPRSTRPLVTDRALRYRAQRNPPPGPELCAYCGAGGPTIEIEHVDGHEENGGPENLVWACRSCNTAKGQVFRDAAIGRPTRQYNPPTAAELRAERDRLYVELDKIMSTGKNDRADELIKRIHQLEKLLRRPKRQKNPERPKKAGSIAQWKAAVGSLMGYGPWTPAAAVKMVQATPAAARGRFAEQLARRQNPGATSSAQYFISAQIMRGAMPGDQAKAYQLIMDTPAHQRSQWDREAWKHRKEVYGPSGRRQQSLFSDDNVPF